MRDDDTWIPRFEHKVFSERFSENGRDDGAFGKTEVVVNEKPLFDKVVWVTGDSFVPAMKPFLEVAFKEVHYLGHWDTEVDSLAEKLKASEMPPDIVFLVRVERAF